MKAILLFVLKWSPGAIWFRFFGAVALSALQAGHPGEAAFIFGVGVVTYLYAMRALRRRFFALFAAVRS